MAKPTVPRHSKSPRKSVTIELEPSSVTKPASQSKPIPEPEPVGFKPPIETQPVSTASPSEDPAVFQATADKQTFGRAEKKPFSAGPAGSTGKTSDPLGRLASGFIGGLVALIGAAGLQWAGVLPSPKANTSALESQIAELRSRPSPAQTLDEGAQIALNGAVENAKQALGQVSGLSDELKTIKQSVSDIQKAPGTGAAVDTSAIDARIGALEEQLNASQQKVAEADGAAAGATQRLSALEAKVNDTSAQTNMALFMAATGLKAAVDRGEPYTAELDTYVSVAPANGDIEALRASATKGIPTTSSLASRFGDVAARIIASAHPVDPNAGVVDRLWASASSLVESRPVGMVEGEGADAISARIEAHLNTGDLNAAIAEWEKLPADAKTGSMEFGNAMKARQTANTTVSKVLSDALTGVKAAPAAAN